MSHFKSTLAVFSLLSLFPLATQAKSAVPIKSKNVAATQIANFISRYKLSLDQATGTLKVSGLIHPDCKDAINLEVRELDNGKIPVRVIVKESAKCTPEKTSTCDRDTCFDASKVEGLVIGATLRKTGELVYRTEDLSFPEGDPEAIRDVETGLLFKDKETLAKEETDRLEFERQLLVAETCTRAEQGDRDAIAELTNLGASEETIKVLKTKADEAELAKLQALIEIAGDSMRPSDTITNMANVAKAVKAFAKEHPEQKERCASILAGMVETLKNFQAPEGNTLSEQKFDNNRYKLAESLLKSAKDLSPKEESYRVAYDTVRLDHAKWAAQTGDPFYYSTVLPGATNAAYDIGRLAAKSDSPEVQTALKEFQDTFSVRAIPFDKYKYVLHTGQGTALDAIYFESLNRILENQSKKHAEQYKSIMEKSGYQLSTPTSTDRPATF